MKIQKTNIFIVDDDRLILADIKILIEERFGDSVSVTTFTDGESCLEMIYEDLHIVILDYYMENKNGMEVLKAIKLINPKTEVIMLTSNEDMLTAIESLRAGAKEFVVKGSGSLTQVSQLVNYLITTRIRILARELITAKYMTGLIIVITFICLSVLYIVRIKK